MITSFTIDGVDQIVPTRRVRLPSVQIVDEVNERNTCSFTLIDVAGTYRPKVGQAIQIVRDGTLKIFGGLIHDFDETIAPGPTGLARFFSVNCVDWTVLLDRRVVNAEYSNMTLQAVVQDFVTTYLAGDGVTLDPTMEIGPTLEHLVFPDVAVSQALNELSQLTAYQWYVDYDKVLHVFSQAYFAAPSQLTDLANWRELTVTRSLGQYRNKQYVRAGDDISDVQTEEFHGNGKQVSFATSMPVALAPSVLVNGTAKTVGVLNVDSGKDWYWNKGDNQITQDTAGVKLVGTDTLTVQYQGLFPIKVMGKKQSAIADRASVEGFGTGIYEAVEDATEINRLALAQDKATGLLRKYALIPPSLTFKTVQDGYRAGQVLPVNLLKHGLSGNYLITRVDINDLSNTAVMYKVQCVDGEALDSDIALFRKLIQDGQKFTIRDNEVIDNLVNLDDVLGVTDQLTVTVATGQSGEFGTTPEFDEWGTAEWGP